MATTDFKRSRYCNFLLCTAFILLLNTAKYNTALASTIDISPSSSYDTVMSTPVMTNTTNNYSDTSSTSLSMTPTSSLDVAPIGNDNSSSSMTQMFSSSIEMIPSSSSVSYNMTMTNSSALSENIDSSYMTTMSYEPTTTFGNVVSITADSSMNGNTVVMNSSSTLPGEAISSFMSVSMSDSLEVNQTPTPSYITESTANIMSQTDAQTSVMTSNVVESSIKSSTSDTVSTSTPVIPSSSIINTTTNSSIAASSVQMTSSIRMTSSLQTTSSIQTTSSVQMTISVQTTSSVEMTSSVEPTSAVAATSSVAPSTTPTTIQATTQNPTTTGIPDKVSPPINENTVYNVKATIIMVNCIKDNYELRTFLLDLLEDIKGLRDVIIITNTCGKQKRKKRDTTQNTVDTQLVVGASNNNKTTIINEIVEAFNKSTNASIQNETDFIAGASEMFKDICKSNICDAYPGFNCDIEENGNHACISECYDEKCSGHGQCHIVVESIGNYGKRCICDSEEFYKYQGETCETKRMKWELAVAIAGGVGGAIILILLFIICLCCCCKRNDDKYEYNRPASYEPMSDLLNRSPLYRNEGVKTHQAGFANFGFDNESYGEDISAQPLRQTNGHQSWHPEASKHDKEIRQSWNPEASKETYAKIAEKIEKEKSFQIKRPQLSTSSKRQGDPGEAATGF